MSFDIYSNIHSFKNILIINLQKRQDRLINVYEQLDSINLSDTTIRIKAICDDDAYNYIDMLSNDAVANIINLESTCIIPNLSALGCAVSHINCWKYIVNNNLEYGIIVEDDIKITDNHFFNFDLCVIKNFVTEELKTRNTHNCPIFVAVNPKANNDIKVYNYGYWYENDHGKEDIVKNKVYNLSKPFTGTYFYYVNRQMASYLLQNITKLTYQIDIEIGMLAVRERYNNMFFGYTTDNLTTENLGTDIQTYIIDQKYLGKCLRDINDIPETITDIIYSYLPDIQKKIKIDNNIKDNNII